MKNLIRNQNSALTLIEGLMVIATVFLLAMFILPFLGHNHNRDHGRIRCVNNLKQVGLAFRLYAGDNRDRYPMNLSTNDQQVVNEATPVYLCFQSLSNELGIPKLLVCYSDENRLASTNFSELRDTNISYFVGLDADETLTNSILAGDRNIQNGIAPDGAVLRLATNQMVEFTDEIHRKQGNIALGDGSVHQVSSARLRSEIIRNAPFAANRIKLP